MLPQLKEQLFAILQKYDFSSKSQHISFNLSSLKSCLRYCKSTIFQANHNTMISLFQIHFVVCDTAKVRFFKQITTPFSTCAFMYMLFAILQKYDFSSKSQHKFSHLLENSSCLRYCKSTIFQANHNPFANISLTKELFAILQKYDFSSKSQQKEGDEHYLNSCLRYCKSTIFQANHNCGTSMECIFTLFAILQKYDFSSKSQRKKGRKILIAGCLRYCKSTIFQVNHNYEVLI